jgi:pyruvate dehydrogenase E2 component (dihydrolipoamide acetyltransferase)
MFDFKFPDVGEGIHEGVIVAWLVEAGDTVRMDQPFVKVETDKAVVDLPAPRGGAVLALHFAKGATIRVGDVIATFGEAGEAPAQAAAPIRSAETIQAESPLALGFDGRMAPSSGALTPDAAATQVPSPAAPPPGGGKPMATPHTRAYARKRGVELSACVPTGKNGRITDEDVDRALSGTGAVAPQTGVPAPQIGEPGPGTGVSAPQVIVRLEVTDAGPVEKVAVTHLRKVIAQAMALSARTSAHVTHVDEADVTDLVSAYRRLKSHIEKDGATKFSLMPLFIKAAVTVLKDHPIFNASYDEAAGQIVFKRYYHIGVAVDTPEGLIVPVVRDADRKDMVALARELADMASRARERRLTLDELRGGSFTLTNIGAIGGLMATPIIHQPELAIGGLFAIKDKPAVVDGQVVPRKFMNLSVTFDHRVIDGAQGARFMRDLVQLLEHPELLMARL